MRLLPACLVAIGCSSPAGSPIDAATVPDSTPRELDILWIGAHPDDELYLAPALGSFCVDGGQRCELLVLTHGERGTCKRPALCGSDLPGVRMSELEASAQVLRAPAEQWDLGDGTASSPDAVLAAWAARSGGQEVLIARVREAISARRPKKIFTFDPRHGSSCHADHRAAGTLVYLALQELGADAPPLAFVEAVVEPNATGTAVGFRAAVPADTAVTRFDATVASPALGGPAWGFLDRVVRAHASQFTDAEVAAIAAAADPVRATFWLELAAVVDNDARYAGACN